LVHRKCYVHDSVNMADYVNTPGATGAGFEPLLLKTLGEILREVGCPGGICACRAERSTPDGANAVVDLGPEKGRRAELRVHVKKDLRPGVFPGWAENKRPVSKGMAVPVLALPSVSPRLADLCKQAGWSWYDLAGNCRIVVPGRLHIERSGIAAVRRPPPPGANLGTAAAARVLRALLSPAHAGREWTQRGLQTKTCWDESVSLGLVNKVIRYVRDEGFVEEVVTGGVRVRDPGGLLAAWSKAYRFERHERHSYFSLLKGAELRKALYLVGGDAGGMAAYAAFSAAERQAPHVHQPKTWLYIAADFLDSLIRHTRAKEVDSGENMVVLIPDDPGVFLSFAADSYVGEAVLCCTDPVQTYVDLLHCGGRGEEAAKALLDQKILPAWKPRP
jgi:hypothetical protein